MKRQLIYMLAAAALITGCSENEESGAKGFGSLRITGATDITIDTRTTTTPSGDAFSLELTGESYRGVWKTIADFAAADTVFKEGRYTATITYGDPAVEGVDKPCYAGSQEFELLPRRINTVEITARITNSQVFVRTTEAFRNYFHDAVFTVTTGSANTFTFTPRAASTDVPVFVMAATSLSIKGTARRQSQTGVSEGVAVNFKEQTLEATTPRTCHTFLFDAKNAGSATLTIYLGDDYTETLEIDAELNDDSVVDPTE